MAICTKWDRFDPEEVAAWPAHRVRFYEEWLEAIAPPDEQGVDQPFDPLKPSSGAFTPDVLAGMGAQVRVAE